MEHQHLSENEILELVQANREQSDYPAAIQNCEVCRQSYDDNRMAFERLHQDSQLKPSVDLWSRIELKHTLERQKRKNRKAMYGFGAIAASLMLMVGIQWNAMVNNNSLQNQIQASILQSQQLEKVLLSNQSNVKVSFATRANISQELLEIDEALQNAYLDDVNQEEILRLWEKRVKILVDSLTQEKEQTDLVTI